MKIITDCAADLPQEDIEEHDITVAPLFIQFPEGEINSDDITPDDFYNRLEAMAPRFPTTAQPAAGIFADFYRKFAALGEEIFSIHISSGLSGTIQSARLGAAQVPEAKVNLVDTLTLSGGERFQVLAAARAILAGWKPEAIIERLHKIQQSTELIYTLETLDYLARGGRIGRVQALAGSLLRLKPVIHVDHEDGKYDTVGKARTMPKAVEILMDSVVSKYSATTPLWVTVLHGRFAEQASIVANMVQDRLRVAKLEVLRISPVLGVHTGPGIVGMGVVPISLMEDFG